MGDLDFVRVPTLQLTTMVAHYRGALPQGQFTSLIEDIRKMFEKYSAILAAYAPGLERARAVHRLLNTTIEHGNQVKPTCAAGCGACCHLEVEITQDEGELLASLIQQGLEIDRARLGQQASRNRKSSEWAQMVNPNNACVFLDAHQSCRVYDSRPAICRKHLVASPPDECGKSGGQPQPILIPLAEVLLSAALSQPGNPFQSLSKSVTAALNAPSSIPLGEAQLLPVKIPEAALI